MLAETVKKRIFWKLELIGENSQRKKNYVFINQCQEILQVVLG